MLRVTTIHASSAANTASYYTHYLTAAPGEVPGVWSGRQATALGLSGTVQTEPLELLLSGRDPVSGTPLGRELVDRVTRDGRVVKAVSGFDATFSAPKSLSVWWGLTGDRRLLEAHDVAVAAALEHLERLGSTTRIRRDGGRLHPDTGGVTMAAFRQTTSRADDPQVHTHAVMSAKVQTDDGCWWALDGRYLKRHQRMLGGLYQSVLRSELTHRFGIGWGPIVNGQAEIAGIPNELLSAFSKRAADIDIALAAKVDDFRDRHGCEPSRSQRAAMEREAAADTRGRKSGHGAADLVTRWRSEAADAGWTVDQLVADIEASARDRAPSVPVTVGEVVAAVSARHSSWGRSDVLQAICDAQRPVSQMSGRRWLDTLERAADRVLEHCVDLDPPDATQRRASDGRSLWIEPTAPRFTSQAVLAEEEHIVTWAIDAQGDPPAPSTTVNGNGLDVLQAAATASVAGHDSLVLVVGPAGAGKTRMLAAAVADLHERGRAVFGVAPTAKAARVLDRDTGMRSDTVAKLLHEWHRGDRPPLREFQPRSGTTVVVDEAGMVSTGALYQLVTLAEAQRWRLVLVGDHRQLQAVGRGGLFAELCAQGRVDELERLHRFTHRWEAAASLLLRSGDPRALDAYEAHGRITPGSVDAHLERMATTWIARRQRGETVALVASTNDHVDAINRWVQAARLNAGHLDGDHAVPIAGDDHVHVGDVVATRRNDRTLITSAGEPVRNRETWTVTAIREDGSLTVRRERGHGTVTLPAGYAHEHVRLGYAATEHGYQSDTVDHSIALTSSAATRRGLYVAATRGRDENLLCVVTDSDDVAEARDVLEGVLAVDRADIPAVTQRRALAHQTRGHETDAPAGEAAARCLIPAWFEPLHHQALGDLAVAKARQARLAAERERLHGAVAAAERELARVEMSTRRHRQRLAAVEADADRAKRERAAAEWRLHHSGIRLRRQARREFAAAANQAVWAEHQLDRARALARPHVARYSRASAAANDAHDALHHHLNGRRERHTPNYIRELEQRCDALDSWRRWATGDTIDGHRLAAALDRLLAANGIDADQDRALGQVVQQWATTTGVDLPTQQPAKRTREIISPDLGR
jgi:conjugative relaxase-like TrwC/TraI family protein